MSRALASEPPLGVPRSGSRFALFCFRSVLTAESHSAARNGLLALLLPLVAVVAALIWQSTQHGAQEHDRAEPPVDGASVVAAWTGRADAGDRTWSAVLSRMHALDERQAFEAKALGEHFGRRDGEPWRLQLRASDSTPVNLAGIRIQDAAGRELGPLVRKGDAVLRAGPTAVLFAPPVGTVPSDGRRTLVLWGVEPGQDVRVVGLEHDGQPWSLSLDPDSVPLESVNGPIIQIGGEEPR